MMKKPTNKALDLAAMSGDLAAPPTASDVRFMHAVLCQLGLPRRRVEGREWQRQSGQAWLHVQAGYLDLGESRPVAQPLPYGSMPRLALAYISTEAVRSRSSTIELGDSASAFLRRMGIEGTDGRRYSTLRRQMQALAACRLIIGGGGTTYQGAPIESFTAWYHAPDSGQRPLWQPELRLSQPFYESLLDGAVPLDWRAMMALRGSSMAMDIYTWLAHRLHRIGKKPVQLHWPSLREQFGGDYADPRSFRREFKARLADALAVYPEARIESVPGGLLLRHSPPPVSRRL